MTPPDAPTPPASVEQALLEYNRRVMKSLGRENYTGEYSLMQEHGADLRAAIRAEVNQAYENGESSQFADWTFALTDGSGLFTDAEMAAIGGPSGAVRLLQQKMAAARAAGYAAGVEEGLKRAGKRLGVIASTMRENASNALRSGKHDRADRIAERACEWDDAVCEVSALLSNPATSTLAPRPDGAEKEAKNG